MFYDDSFIHSISIKLTDLLIEMLNSSKFIKICRISVKRNFYDRELTDRLPLDHIFT